VRREEEDGAGRVLGYDEPRPLWTRERDSPHFGDAESFRQACWSVAPTLDVEVGGPESQREVQVRRDGIHVNAPRLGRAHGAHHLKEYTSRRCSEA
jgi:hypothetical protein